MPCGRWICRALVPLTRCPISKMPTICCPCWPPVLQHWLPGQALQIMGFSLGGMTAALLAAAYPALVRQLVLVGPPGLGLRDKPLYRLEGLAPSEPTRWSNCCATSTTWPR